MRRGLVVTMAALLGSCQPRAGVLTDAERAAIADSIAALVRTAIAAADRLDAAGALRDFDADARAVVGGYVYPSVEQYRQFAEGLYGTLAEHRTTPSGMHVLVLSPEAVAVTVPLTATVKTKKGATAEVAAVWTTVWHKRGGRWKVVQSHESVVEPERLMRALGG